MSDQPTCGKCGGVMTPGDSRLRPELFLHDACLPDDLKPVATQPTTCPQCGIDMHTPAERFLHVQVHAARWNDPADLNKLPFNLFPRVARLMDDYARHHKEQPQ